MDKISHSAYYIETTEQKQKQYEMKIKNIKKQTLSQNKTERSLFNKNHSLFNLQFIEQTCSLLRVFH